MRRDPKSYLWDAADSAETIKRFTAGKSYDDYLADRMLRSAVERQLGIIGEAFSQLAKIDPQLAAQIPELPRIVAFRNLLIHGYAVVDDQLVWRAVHENIPQLLVVLQRLLAT